MCPGKFVDSHKLKEGDLFVCYRKFGGTYVSSRDIPNCCWPMCIVFLFAVNCMNRWINGHTIELSAKYLKEESN